MNPHHADLDRQRRSWCQAALLGTGLGSLGLGVGSASAAATLPAPHPWAGFELLDAHGQKFQPGSLVGKTVLVNLVFTQCSSTCATTTSELVTLHRRILAAQAKDAAAQRLVMVTLSVDPLNDTPPALKQFATARGVSFERWHWLTGRPTEVARFVNAVVGPEMGQKKPAEHLSSLMLFSPSGLRMARFRGVGINVDQVLRESLRVDRFANQAA